MANTTPTFHVKRVPLPLPEDNFLDIATFICSRPHSGHVTLIDAAIGRRLTYSNLWCVVDAVATSLSVNHGVRKGQVSLLLSPNSILFPIALIAVLSLDAVVTTTNLLNTPLRSASRLLTLAPSSPFTVWALVPKLAGTGLSVVLLDESGDVAWPDSIDVVSTLGEMIKSNLSCRKISDHNGGGMVGHEMLWQDDKTTMQSPPY